MALESKVLTFTANTGTGDQDLTGTSFTPKTAILWWTRVNNAADTFAEGATIGMGFTDGTNQRCIYANSEDLVGTSDTARVRRDASLITTHDVTGTVTTVDSLAGFVSFLSNGMRINWSNAPAAAFKIHVLFLGGTDITDVKVGTFTETSTTGNVDITDVGFQPDGLMCITTGSTTGTPGTNGCFQVGAADADANQWTQYNVWETGRNTTDTWQYYRPDRFSCLLASTTGAVSSNAAFVSMLSNGFRINNDDTDSNTYFYLAIKGCAIAAGSATEPAGTGDQTVTTNKDCKAVMVFGNDTGTSGSTQTDSVITIGGGTANEQAVIVTHDLDNVGDSVTTTRYETDSIYLNITANTTATSSAIDDEASLSSVSSTGFTLNWSNIGNARPFRYVTFGSAAVSTTPISTTKTHKYHITGLITRQRTHKYNVIGKVSRLRTHKFHILSKVSKSKTHLWNILKLITRDKTHKYNVILQVLSTKTHLYNLLNSVLLSRTHLYNVIAKVTVSKTHLYNVSEALAPISTTKTHKYNIITKITQTKTHKYDILAPITQVSKTKTHKYHIDTDTIKLVHRDIDSGTGYGNLITTETGTDASLEYTIYPYNTQNLDIISESGIIPKIDWDHGNWVFRLRIVTPNSEAHLRGISIFRYSSDTNFVRSYVYSDSVDIPLSEAKVYAFNIRWDETSESPPNVDPDRAADDRVSFTIGLQNFSASNAIFEYGVNLSNFNDESTTPIPIPAPTQVSTTKTHKYNVIAKVTVSKTHKYDVSLAKFQVSKNHTHKYNIIVKVTISKTHKYDVQLAKFQVTKSKTHKYDIRTKLTQTKTHRYNVVGKVTQTKTHKYDILAPVSQVSQTKTHKYNVIITVSRSHTHKYNILIKVSSLPKHHKYNVIGKVTTSKTHKYNVRVQITSTKTHIYNLSNSVSKSKTHNYNVTGKVIAPRTHPYNIVIRATVNKTHKYHINYAVFPVNTSQTHKYNVIARVTKTKSHKYSILNSVTQTKTHLYNLIGKVTKSKTHKYNVLVSISTVSKTHKWNAKVVVSTTRTHKYNVIKKLSVSKTHRYNIPGKITRTHTHKYDISGIRTPLATTKIHVYDILSKVTTSKTHKYSIVSEVSKSTTYKYNIEGIVTTSKTHLYNIIQKISVSKTHIYQIIIRIVETPTKTHRYNILALSTQTKTHKYNIIGRITRTHTHLWNSGGTVLKSKTHKYDIAEGRIIGELGGSTNVLIKFPERVRIIDIIADIRNLAIANVEIFDSQVKPQNTAIGFVQLLEQDSRLPTSLRTASSRFNIKVASQLIVPEIEERIENRAISGRIAIEELPLSPSKQFQTRSHISLYQKSAKILLTSSLQLKPNDRSIINLASKTEMIPRNRFASVSRLELAYINNILLRSPEIMTKEREQTLNLLTKFLSNDDLFY